MAREPGFSITKKENKGSPFLNVHDQKYQRKGGASRGREDEWVAWQGGRSACVGGGACAGASGSRNLGFFVPSSLWVMIGRRGIADEDRGGGFFLPSLWVMIGGRKMECG
ncbi:hypothetical protein AMTR_s00065p00161710 [Amborella trichopoda]|uniref:Uncharacterized protein n=1 Tax=Amborella trichopoda TaxID=13333 RepID=U5CZ57_AMBTC|nr:hypothetical protein AMTR_s00065p00161710 [Amborella trichopoda]